MHTTSVIFSFVFLTKYMESTIAPPSVASSVLTLSPRPLTVSTSLPPLIPDDYDIYIHYDDTSSQLPPPNNISPWITFACQYPDHIFNLRKFLRARSFHKAATGKVSRFATLQIQGTFHDHGATLSIRPIWILSHSELKQKQPMAKLKISDKKRGFIYWLVRAQLDLYGEWVRKTPSQRKRSHTIREIDPQNQVQMDMFQHMCHESLAVNA